MNSRMNLKQIGELGVVLHMTLCRSYMPVKQILQEIPAIIT